MTQDTLTVLRAAEAALQEAEKLANARGFDRIDGSASQILWYGLRDTCKKSAHDIRTLIAAMEAAQPVEQPALTLDDMTPMQFALTELHKFQEATGCDTADQLNAQPDQNKELSNDS